LNAGRTAICRSLRLLLMLATMPVSAGELSGRADVLDGDSLRIGRHEIRLHGIDAPEYRQTCMQGDRPRRCGIEALKALEQMIGANPVRCTWDEHDTYGRALATCYVNGENLNARLVAAGVAVAYTRYSSRYESEQREARDAARGVWATDFDPPWRWRREHPRARTP
jgi:endonuclease YncB( thermonuclease family)